MTTTLAGEMSVESFEDHVLADVDGARVVNLARIDEQLDGGRRCP